MSGPAVRHAADQQRWLRYAGLQPKSVSDDHSHLHTVSSSSCGASPILRCLKVWQLNLVHARDRVLILRSKESLRDS